MSKDVMMARRVGGSMDSVDAAHYSSGGASAQQSSYQPPPISNYKGVMLCDRPVNKAAGSKVPQATASGQQMPFNCSTGPQSKLDHMKAPGLNQSREHREHIREVCESLHDQITKERDVNNFLKKHRAWLSKLKQSKSRQREESEEASVMRELKMKRFKAYAAKLRATIRQIKQDGGSGMGLSREEVAQHVEGGGKKKDKRPEKPAWALSVAEAEQVEEADVDDLLNFAQSLDFDKYVTGAGGWLFKCVTRFSLMYVDDLEVRQALQAVRNRINELADRTDEKVSQIKAKQEEQRQDGVAPLDLDKLNDNQWKKTFADEWNKANRGGNTDRSNLSTSRSRAQEDADADDDLRSVGSRASHMSQGSQESQYDAAQRVLQTSRSLRSTHSNRSIRELMKKQAAKGGLDSIAEEGEADFGPTTKPPQIQKYHKDDLSAEHADKHAAKQAKVDASNLPYLHRNPAV